MKVTMKNKTILRLACALVATIGVATGCNADLNVGDGPLAPDRGPTGDGGSTTVRVWSGYSTRYKFNSGSDRITVTFTSPTTGTVVFGVPPDGTEVVDPSHPYPSDCPDPGHLVGSGSLLPCAERFVFQMHDAKEERERLRFSVNLSDKWAKWCEGQKFIVIGSWGAPNGAAVRYSCAGVAPGIPHCEYVPDDAGGATRVCSALPAGYCEVTPAQPDGGPDMVMNDAGYAEPPPVPTRAVDCRLARSCEVCTCTTTKCGLAPGPLFALSFDLHIFPDGKSASDGTTYLTAESAP